MAKVDAWMAQREEIVRELRDAADKIASGENPFPWRQGGRLVNTAGSSAKRKRRKMSAKARKAISDAQKARWAKQKKAQR